MMEPLLCVVSVTDVDCLSYDTCRVEDVGRGAGAPPLERCGRFLYYMRSHGGPFVTPDAARRLWRQGGGEGSENAGSPRESR